MLKLEKHTPQKNSRATLKRQEKQITTGTASQDYYHKLFSESSTLLS